MKVVIFCGGLGVRMGEATQRIPKPMIADRDAADPLAPHEVVRVLGPHRLHPLPRHRAEVVKDYFLAYNEALANDFVLSNGGRDVELLGSDISDWRITFVDTGVQSSIGERLRRVGPHLGDDDTSSRPTATASRTRRWTR